MAPLVIGTDDPRAHDVQAVLARHLEFARQHTLPQDVYALELDGFSDPTITLFSARRDRQIVAVGALRRLDERHGELKAMHTVEEARRGGVGRAMVDHLVAVARQRRYRRVSLETGATEAFAPSRSLYESCGFHPCDSFGDYPDGPNSTFMTLALV